MNPLLSFTTDGAACLTIRAYDVVVGAFCGGIAAVCGGIVAMEG